MLLNIFLASNNTKRESISTIAHKTCQIGLSNSNNTLQSSFKIEYMIIKIQKVTIKVTICKWYNTKIKLSGT